VLAGLCVLGNTLVPHGEHKHPKAGRQKPRPETFDSLWNHSRSQLGRRLQGSGWINSCGCARVMEQ
jgi:hypothetical protein